MARQLADQPLSQQQQQKGSSAAPLSEGLLVAQAAGEFCREFWFGGVVWHMSRVLAKSSFTGVVCAQAQSWPVGGCCHRCHCCTLLLQVEPAL